VSITRIIMTFVGLMAIVGINYWFFFSSSVKRER